MRKACSRRRRFSPSTNRSSTTSRIEGDASANANDQRWRYERSIAHVLVLDAEREDATRVGSEVQARVGRAAKIALRFAMRSVAATELAHEVLYRAQLVVRCALDPGVCVTSRSSGTPGSTMYAERGEEARAIPQTSVDGQTATKHLMWPPRPRPKRPDIQTSSDCTSPLPDGSIVIPRPLDRRGAA
jgi:hypothetical protein